MRIVKSTNRFQRKKWQKASWRVLAGLVLLIPVTWYAMLAVGWWLDYSDQPQPCDILVVLAGGFSRPFYAADLYQKGYAPEIWISRPVRLPGEVLVDSLGIPYPREEDINREILLRKGVPDEKIHFYGNAVKSTVNEALVLKGTIDTHGKKIMVVTSRWHARRTSWIFKEIVNDASIRVVASPYEPFSRRWWKNQEMARAAMLEPVKMIFFLIGGRFLSAA